jgi:D-glycero-beta-D-manno-heptose 1-phosphate adenylyltransferase
MPGRVLDLPALLAELESLRAAGGRVVLTNGVFDLLHVGHLRYLRRARAEGDVLVVGLNTDASIRAFKPGRPLVPAAERAELLAALEPVDFVVPFDELSADDLLRAIRPHVYVKGGDYTEASLPEADSARSVGAQIVLVPLVAGHSTTALLARLDQLERRTPIRIMCVYAHPDDESFGPAAVLARYAQGGAEIHGLWATRGEHGQTVDEPGPNPAELARLREQDLREAAALVGFRDVSILDYEDGALDQAPAAELQEHVLACLRRVQPQIVLTFGPAGITRHPDHVAIHRATVEAFHQARAEGIPLQALFFDAVTPDRARTLNLESEPDGQPNTWIDVSTTQHVKLQALRLHARHVLDARDRADRLEREPRPTEPLHRAWPPAPEGVVLSELLPD